MNTKQSLSRIASSIILTLYQWCSPCSNILEIFIQFFNFVTFNWDFFPVNWEKGHYFQLGIWPNIGYKISQQIFALSTEQAPYITNISNLCICDILEQFSHLQASKEFVFCLIRGHIGIKGNERVGASAKSPLIKPISNVKVLHTDLKSQSTESPGVPMGWRHI